MLCFLLSKFGKVEVHDLLLLLAYMDEQKVLDKLPQYVAASPDSMPSLRLYEGDLSVLMALLHSMNSRFSEFGSALAAITSVVHTLQSSGPPELSRGRPFGGVMTMIRKELRAVTDYCALR